MRQNLATPHPTTGEASKKSLVDAYVRVVPILRPLAPSIFVVDQNDPDEGQPAWEANAAALTSRHAH